MKPLIRIVDDESSVRESLSYLLELEGYSVKTWSSPLKYLQEDEPSRPGCLILDVMMPEMTGYEIQNLLIERSQHIPIIFISAYGEIEAVVRTMKLGAVDFLQKPLDPEKVIEAVKQALRQQELIRSDSLPLAEVFRRFSLLTEREKQILLFAYQGFSNSQIGTRLGISRKTVENHRAMSYRKLQISSAQEMKQVIEAIKRRDDIQGDLNIDFLSVL